MKTVIALILGTCLAFLATARAGEGGTAPRGSITLKDAITKALAHDPTVRKVFSDVIQADGFAKEMRADMRPQVFWKARPARRDGTEARRASLRAMMSSSAGAPASWGASCSGRMVISPIDTRMRRSAWKLR